MGIFCMLWIKWSFKSLLYNCRLDLHIQYRACDIELQTFLDLKEAVFRENVLKYLIIGWKPRILECLQSM